MVPLYCDATRFGGRNLRHNDATLLCGLSDGALTLCPGLG